MQAANIYTLLAIADAQLAGSDPQALDVIIARDLGLDYSVTNEVYYGSAAGPVSPATVSSLDTVSTLSLSSASFRGTNMGDFFRSVTVPTTGVWKITFVINNGKYGRAESHCISGAADQATALAAGRALGLLRASCLGSNSNAANPAKSPANPLLEFIRISDAVNQRLGATQPFSNTNGGFGPGGSSTYAADFFGTAITLRLTGTGPTPGAIRRNVTLQIVGQPDGVYDNGAIKPSATVAAGVSFFGNLDAYVNQLISGPGQWGFMGVTAAELKMPVTLFSNAGGAWTLTIGPNAYAPRDRIRLTGVNVRGFNGTYMIGSVSANTITLAKGPPVSYPVPTTGAVQRYQLANGTRLLDFYKYSSLVNGGSTAFAAKVSNKDPGRELLGVSFGKKAKKP